MNGPREIRLFRSAVWSLIQAMSEAAVNLFELEDLGCSNPKYVCTARWHRQRVSARRSRVVRRGREALDAGYKIMPIYIPGLPVLIRDHAAIMEGRIDLTIYWEHEGIEYCITPAGIAGEMLKEEN